ncbi:MULTISPECIES: XTP/dITP diphosphatase [unclassified Fusibacter]|uniref:XTP/dITP diphosphatase n=1 Tax=unclassified Fusibacter TaxID=2624464 RepID=UPI001010E012|nr:MULTISPECIES: XTP/dITP diphosphatase [unclassified Fusibacter]MCK8060794.1 XTP/dITP diphosphatase [Fusibacter sp. A2]NPE23090.1 XTP/dITP diphosphatase [Fusibacter sp. A1]RXV59760.1 XTP/dITP diphosphatase [Fusibacter sp. A1]
MKQILMATQNKNKLKEVREMLEPLGITVLSMDDVDLGEVDVIEDGDTFEHNALKKAKEIAVLANTPVLADDSGLMVDALGGAPGVYSARFSGVDATSKTNNDKLLKELADVPKEGRGAKFVCVMAYATPQGEAFTTRGEAHGFIIEELKGEGGFGYDPLFYVTEYEKTYAELGPVIKNKISHRAKALTLMKKELEVRA